MFVKGWLVQWGFHLFDMVLNEIYVRLIMEYSLLYIMNHHSEFHSHTHSLRDIAQVSWAILYKDHYPWEKQVFIRLGFFLKLFESSGALEWVF